MSLRRWMTWCLAMVITVFTVGTSPSTVVCLGLNGHLAFEQGSHGRCGDLPAEEHEPNSEDLDSHGHPHTPPGNDKSQSCCGQCIDFTLELEIGDIHRDLLAVNLKSLTQHRFISATEILAHRPKAVSRALSPPPPRENISRISRHQCWKTVRLLI